METKKGPQRLRRAPVPRAGQPVCGHGRRTVAVPQRQRHVLCRPENPRLRPSVSVSERAREGAAEDGPLSAGGVCVFSGCGGAAEPRKPKGSIPSHLMFLSGFDTKLFAFLNTHLTK